MLGEKKEGRKEVVEENMILRLLLRPSSILVQSTEDAEVPHFGVLISVLQYYLVVSGHQSSHWHTEVIFTTPELPKVLGSVYLEMRKNTRYIFHNSNSQ